jgi:hypothetical protein
VAIGANGPGTLRQYGIYQAKHLVHLPKNLSWEEVSDSGSIHENIRLNSHRARCSHAQASLLGTHWTHWTH